MAVVADLGLTVVQVPALAVDSALDQRAQDWSGSYLGISVGGRLEETDVTIESAEGDA
jgi:hypothetical protein